MVSWLRSFQAAQTVRQGKPLRRGWYETEYGNSAIYKGGKTAHDVDSDSRVPVEVLGQSIRPLRKGE